MGNERIVVVKEQKRGGFWPFVGGLVLGAIAVKAIGSMMKDKQETETQPTPEIKNQDEIRLIEDLIDELASKPNKTEKDRNNIDLLRIKLGQLRSE